MLRAEPLFGGNSFGADFQSTSNARGGARAVALGKAFVATADDPSAIFYNPAGIAFAKRSYISLHFDYLPQNNYTSYLSFMHSPQKESKWGFGLAIIESFNHKIKLYDNNASPSKNKLNYSTALIISIARLLDEKEKFSIGFNLKAIHRSIGGKLSYGAGLDFGFKGSLPFIDFGIFIGDIITFEQFTYKNKITYYDRILKLAIASNFSSYFTLALQIDKNLSTNDDVIFRIGSFIKIWGENTNNIPNNKENNIDLAKDINIKNTNFNNALYLNIGYGNKQIGIGFTLTIWKLGFDISASFSELSIEECSALFTLNIPIY